MFKFKKQFRIVRINKHSYVIQQRHTFLFIFHFWDKEAIIMDGNHWANSFDAAYKMIVFMAQKKNFTFNLIV